MWKVLLCLLSGGATKGFLCFDVLFCLVVGLGAQIDWFWTVWMGGVIDVIGYVT